MELGGQGVILVGAGTNVIRARPHVSCPMLRAAREVTTEVHQRLRRQECFQATGVSHGRFTGCARS